MAASSAQSSPPCSTFPPGNHCRNLFMIDRASDAWGAQRELVGRPARVIINVATALAYMVAYLGLREASNDQWYLPAGLRFAALLITPYRLWPALFVGDAAAVVSYRWSMIPDFGWAYYVCSSVAAWPVAALIVRQARRVNERPTVNKPTDAIVLLVAGLLCAELVSLTNKAMVAWLKLGGGEMVYGDLFVYSLGHVQGIILAVFALILGVDFLERRRMGEDFALHSLLAVSLCIWLYAMVEVTGPHDAAALMAYRLCLLVPAVALTLRHGWRGTALGAIAANVALFGTIPHQEAGQADGSALLMQEAFAFVSASLFVLGSRNHAGGHVTAPGAAADSDMHRHTREQFESHERRQRETALRAEALQRDSRDQLGPLVTLLRKSGQAEAAMSLVGMAHTQSSHFGRTVVDSIYPLTLERLGLFAALESEAFAANFGETAHKMDLTGSAHAMSLEAKLAAYRVLGEAVEQLVAYAPRHVSIRIHCSAKPDGRGMISMALRAVDTTVIARSSSQTAQLAQLRNRVMAYGGSLHNRARRIRMIVLDEPVEARVCEAANAPERANVHRLRETTLTP
ncbi:MASE1 domain-containing protein [Luteibacter sp. NPDC031894]|uniref:MASE1 domain-containing protein n=1 Tax=Luteibacter sp. NPDC031894 TaxID=3390572 RepID=UPI003D08E6D0